MSGGRVCRRWRWLFAVPAMVAGWAPLAVAGEDPSAVVYLPTLSGLPFSHATHLGEGRPGCATCHPGAEASIRSVERLLPAREHCLSCHPAGEGTAAGASGAFAAVGPFDRPLPPLPLLPDLSAAPVPAETPPELRLRFSHRQHGAAGIACPTCHPVAERSGRRRPLPLMEQCRGCHRERDAPLSCRSCHPVGPDGLLRTRFAQLAPEYGPLPTGDPARRPEPATPSPGLLRPSGSRLGIGHDLRWSRTHGRVAGGEAQLCQSCHAGEWCRRCHAGRFLPLRIHPAGWQGEHAVASRSGELRCASCHRHSSFCRTCHQRLGVVPPAEGTPHPLAPAARFHPPAWATVSAPGAGHHGEQARRSLPTCVSCHAEETCIRCHRTRELQGLGVSPHSPGIAGRCRSLLRANPRGCVLCHGQALAQDPRCR